MFFDLVIGYSYLLVVLCSHLHCINYHLGHPPPDPPLLHSDNLNCKEKQGDDVVDKVLILTNLF